MDALWVAVAILVAAAAALAVASRVPRQAALGLLVVLVGAPFLGDPSAPVPLLSRIVGGVLAVYLLWIALRDAPARTRGSLVGWPAEGLTALVAFVAGWQLAASLATLSVEPTTLADGPSLAVRGAAGAAAALGVLAVTPVLLSRDVLRLGIGLLLLLTSVDLARRAVGVADSPLGEIALAIATAVVGAAVAWTTGRARRGGRAFELPDDPRRVRR
jgi:hypothetical protein